MRVSIECGRNCIMSKDFGEGFDVDTVFQCHRSEGVTKIMEADVLTSGVLKDS